MARPARDLRLVSTFGASPPTPIGEQRRGVELRSLEMLDTPAEERFDRITRLARRLFDVSIAAVTLIDADRAWLKSAQGMAGRDFERNTSFCAHAMLEAHDLVVEDATRDERFHENPHVTADGGIRFYAGHRLNGPDGHALGALCIANSRPRRFSLEDRDALRDLALIVEQELAVSRLGESQRELVRELDDARRSALLDELTHAWNRRAMVEILERESARARRECASVAVAMIDIDHFKRVNDVHGHPAGDAVIRGAADRLRAAVRAHDAVGRYGGEEFMVVLGSARAADAAVIGERIRAAVARSPIGEIAVTVSVGVATMAAADVACTPSALVAAADRALYEAKRNGRNRVCFA
jgi:diguanylate cyclase (GGDEF)-like protein